MRIEDAQEVWASSHDTPLKALLHGYIYSEECYTIYRIKDGLPVAMFGYTRVDPLHGGIWLLGSKELENHPVRFLKESKYWLNHIQESVPLLFNVVDCRNTTHIRWIEWLGFSFIRTIQEYGPDRLPFIEFARMRCG